MPICPRCNVAYLDSETHTCGADLWPKTGQFPWRLLGYIVLGLVVAYFVGGFLMLPVVGIH